MMPQSHDDPTTSAKRPDGSSPVTAAEVEAEYTLETTARCPSCERALDTIQVVRVLRTRVNFVSTLPRRGQLLVCGRCQTILAGSLGGLL